MLARLPTILPPVIEGSGETGTGRGDSSARLTLLAECRLDGAHRQVGMAGELARPFGRQTHERDGARGERVVSPHPLLALLDGDVGAAQSALLVLADEVAKELVERRFPTGKVSPLVLGRQAFDGPISR